MSGTLELRREVGGLRNYLNGRGVHAGEGLELHLGSSLWLPGRYEYKFGDDGELIALFYFSYECGHHASLGCGCELVVRIPTNAVLRWPEARR